MGSCVVGHLEGFRGYVSENCGCDNMPIALELIEAHSVRLISVAIATLRPRSSETCPCGED
jgi:hypothetical protein